MEFMNFYVMNDVYSFPFGRTSIIILAIPVGIKVDLFYSESFANKLIYRQQLLHSQGGNPRDYSDIAH